MPFLCLNTLRHTEYEQACAMAGITLPTLTISVGPQSSRQCCGAATVNWRYDVRTWELLIDGVQSFTDHVRDLCVQHISPDDFHWSCSAVWRFGGRGQRASVAVTDHVVLRESRTFFTRG